jgi:hypothetical protein
MEKRDITVLADQRAAYARQRKELLSRQIDEIIKVAMQMRYPSFSSDGDSKIRSGSLTAHGIATQIEDDVSRLLKERNIGYSQKQKLGVSAITKRVRNLIKLDC